MNEPTNMEEFEYQSDLKQLYFALQMIANPACDIDKMIKTLDSALTVAPFFDPGLFMQKGDAASQDFKMLRTFQTVRDEVRKCLPELIIKKDTEENQDE